MFLLVKERNVRWQILGWRGMFTRMISTPNKVGWEFQLNYTCFESTDYASSFFLFQFRLFCFIKRVVFLLSGRLMKLCYMEHTQHKVTCKYITPLNIAIFLWLSAFYRTSVANSFTIKPIPHFPNCALLSVVSLVSRFLYKQEFNSNLLIKRTII